MLENILAGVAALLSIALIAIILLQSDKEAGLGALTGNSESYMNKTGKDGKSVLASSTKWVALAWLVVVLSLSLI